MKGNCAFCKISRGEIYSRKVYEDKDFLAFHDIKPAAPVHLLLITREHIVSLQEITQENSELLGRMMLLVSKIAIKGGCIAGSHGGFRLISNSGVHGRQEVPHLHFHILGGPQPWLER